MSTYHEMAVAALLLAAQKLRDSTQYTQAIIAEVQSAYDTVQEASTNGLLDVKQAVMHAESQAHALSATLQEVAQQLSNATVRLDLGTQ